MSEGYETERPLTEHEKAVMANRIDELFLHIGELRGKLDGVQEQAKGLKNEVSTALREIELLSRQRRLGVVKESQDLFS